MASPGARTNLFDQPSTLVGRVTERAVVTAFFDAGARLVTLVGPGGIGKTRIASRFALDQVAAYTAHGGGGVWHCDLIEARSAMAICAVLGATLGVPLGRNTREPEVVAELGAALARKKQILIVLEAFDHLVEVAAATVGVWMKLAPRARFLVTSRTSLGIAGEQRLPISALAIPARGAACDVALATDAVELFVQRARQVRPGLALSEPDIEAIAEIVRRVDGFPLAIELVAARALVMSPAQIRDKLARPLELLGAMRAVVLESVRLLPPATRACFARCTIFRGGFSLVAAEAVLGDDVLPILEALCARSLIRTVTVAELGGELRFHLYEPIREVAAELFADAPERAAIGLAHARHFAALGASPAARDAADAIARLGVELENLVVAHGHALAAEAPELALAITLELEPLLVVRGLFRLRLRLLDAALVAIGGQPATAAHARALISRGHAHRELGALELARTDLQRGLELAVEIADPPLEALALVRLGEVVEIAGATHEARAYYERALARIAAAGSEPRARLEEADARAHLGHALRRERELAAAERELEQAVELYRAGGRREGVVATLYELAAIALVRGDHGVASERFEAGLVLARELGALQVEGAISSALGILRQEQGKLDEAIVCHATAVNIFRDVGNRHREGSALYYLGTASLERRELAQAEAVLAQAADAATAVGAARYEALIASARAAGHAIAGDVATAQVAFERADRAAAACHSEPTIVATLSIHRLQLARVEPDRVARARAIVAGADGDDSRFALRLLEGAAGAISADTLIVRADGAAFRPPGQATDVDLARRQPLRRILAALAERRVVAPGEGLAIDELLAAGWPAETVGYAAAVNRVHVALTALRKLGLRGLLVSGERGYLLDPRTTIRIT